MEYGLVNEEWETGFWNRPVKKKPYPGWIIRNPNIEENISMTADFSKIAFKTKRVEKHVQISEESTSKEFHIIWIIFQI